MKLRSSTNVAIMYSSRQIISRNAR